MRVRKSFNRDVDAMIEIWNEIVEGEDAFPEKEVLDAARGDEFFAEQTYCGIAVDWGGNVHGMYIFHPDKKEGNEKTALAYLAVKKLSREQKTGNDLFTDLIKVTKEKGFNTLRFDAAPGITDSARHLLEKLGFENLGIIRDGFEKRDGGFCDIERFSLNLTD